MGKASRRKQSRRESERRDVAPFVHHFQFEPTVHSSANAPIHHGLATISTSVSASSQGLIASSSMVDRLELNLPEGIPAIAHSQAMTMRSTQVDQYHDLGKVARETALGELLAKGWSILDGVSWTSAHKGEEYSDVDVILTNFAGRSVSCQLTRAQPSDSWELKRGIGYQTRHSMAEVSQEVLSAVAAKVESLAERSDLVLVLDGYILPLPAPALHRISLDQEVAFRASGFLEIWYVALNPRMVICLYPRFAAVKFPSETILEDGVQCDD